MNLEQSTRIAVAFARETARAPKSRLCTACVDVLAVTGAGITLLGGDQSGPICVSDGSIAALEDLQFTIGEGPCQDAFRLSEAVHAPQLDHHASARWPSFVDLAHASGIGAVFAYPLMTGVSSVGVLTLYQGRAGALTRSQNDDSVAMAEVLTETVLSLQAAAPQGELSVDLEEAVTYRAQIYQASGMVAVQLQVPVADALVRIRGHAFAVGQPIATVASDIVARRLRLDDDRSNPGREAPESGSSDPGVRS